MLVENNGNILFLETGHIRRVTYGIRCRVSVTGFVDILLPSQNFIIDL